MNDNSASTVYFNMERLGHKLIKYGKGSKK